MAEKEKKPFELSDEEMKALNEVGTVQNLLQNVQTITRAAEMPEGLLRTGLTGIFAGEKQRKEEFPRGVLTRLGEVAQTTRPPSSGQSLLKSVGVEDPGTVSGIAAEMAVSPSLIPGIGKKIIKKGLEPALVNVLKSGPLRSIMSRTARGLAERDKGELLKGTVGALAFGLDVPSKITRNVGDQLLNSGFQKAAQIGEKFGKDDVAETLLRHGVLGTARGIQKKAAVAAKDLKFSRDDILVRTLSQGGELAAVRPERVFQKFYDSMFSLVKNGSMDFEDAAEIVARTTQGRGTRAFLDEATAHSLKPGSRVSFEALEEVGEHLAAKDLIHEGPMDVFTATAIKTDINAGLNPRAFDAMKTMKDAERPFALAAQGLKEGVEDMVGDVLGNQTRRQFIETNKDLGIFLTVSPSLRDTVLQLERQVSPLTKGIRIGAVASALSSSGAARALPIGALEMGIQTGRLPVVTTTLGGLMKGVSENPVTGRAFRRGSELSIFKAGEAIPQSRSEQVSINKDLITQSKERRAEKRRRREAFLQKALDAQKKRGK